MNQITRTIVALAFVAIFVAPIGAYAQATPPVCLVSLHETAVPVHYGGMRNIVAISPTDMYAAGPSALHWDGRAWTALSEPARVGEFNGVSAASRTDVWFAGTYYPPLRSVQAAPVRTPGLARWDGTRWHTLLLRGVEGVFENVDAVSPTDVWAVGETTNGSFSSLVAHWDGHDLVRVPEASVGGSLLGSILGIAGTPSETLWAVGGSGKDTSAGVIERWDGRRWVVSWSAAQTFLVSVSAISARDAWAVGVHLSPDQKSHRALTLHWDGTGWHEVSLGGLSAAGTELLGVAALSGRDVWAVGDQNGSPLIVHWNGRVLYRASTAMGRGLTGEFQGVTFDGHRVWAVGVSDGQTTPVVDHWTEAECQ